MAAAEGLTGANLLALTGEDALADIRELTLRNHKLHTFDQGDTAQLINLQVMSLSHNLLTSLAGFQHLKNLVSLNLNFNALTTLDGIGTCATLQHLFVSNNRVRDPSPLAACTALQTLHLFRNNIANLDVTMATLVQLPRLKELELGGNPCALAEHYKHRVVLQLELESLDGDAVNQLDYDLAIEYFRIHGGMPPGLGPQVDILTLEDVDASGAAAAAAAGGGGGNGSAADAAVSESGAGAAGDGAGGAEGAPGSSGEARPGSSGCSAVGATAAAAHANGTSSSAANPSSAAAAGIPPRGGRPPSADPGVPPRPGSAAAARNAPAGTSGAAPLLPRPGTASRRPYSASGPGGRPGTASYSVQPTVQLLSNELLNEHPLIIEYLAKHVLMEGLALAEQQAQSGGGGAASGSGGSGNGRGPSFAQRLRDTAAAMNACEDVDTKTLAEQQQELIATPITVRRGMAEEMVAAASPMDLCRQLVRLCEVLIKEVEACRAGRPLSGGSSGRPGTAAGLRPGTSAGRPQTAGAAGPSGGTSSSVLTPAEVGELVQLRAEVERLCKENKALRLENENVYWLAEEVKRLKGQAGAAEGGGGKIA